MARQSSWARLVAAIREQQGYETDVLKALDRPRGAERQIRLAALAPFAVAVSWIVQSWIPLAWLAIYFAWLTLNARWTARLPAAVAGWRLIRFLASLAGDTLLYFAGAVFLALQPGPVAPAVAMAAVAGYMFNAMTEHCEETLLAAVDLVGGAVGCLAVAVALSWGRETGWLSGCAVMVLYTYFAVTLVHTMRTRQRLQESIARGAEMQRMEAVGRIVSGMAREFDRRLTTLADTLDAAAEAENSAKPLIEAAHRQTIEARQITDRLLSFAQIADLRPAPVDLARFLQDLRPTLVSRLPSGIGLDIRADAIAQVVRVDRQQLGAVLLELVDNARAALGPAGQVRIETHDAPRLRETPTGSGHDLPPGAYVRLEVIDSGPGIPEHLIDLVAQPFVTGRATARGPGLGLPMTRGFAEQSGGAAFVDRAPGGGTCVSLLLPALPPGEAAPRVRGNTAAPSRRKAAREVRPARAQRL